MISGNFL